MSIRLLGITFLIGTLFCASGLILTVPGNSDECVFERVEKSNKIQGSYEVVTGSGDIIGTVYGPGGEVHFNSEKAKSNRLIVMAPTSGLYKLCLTNRDRDEKSVAVSHFLESVSGRK